MSKKKLFSCFLSRLVGYVFTIHVSDEFNWFVHICIDRVLIIRGNHCNAHFRSSFTQKVAQTRFIRCRLIN